MDFIKKHYEKIVLAVALLALIGSAAFLAFKASALSQEVSETIRSPKPKGRALDPADIGAYTNAIVSLQAPPTWADGADPFATGDRIVSVEGPKQPDLPPTADPYTVLGVSRRPFKLMFKEYQGEGRRFQVNVLTVPPRTYFVEEVGLPITDQFGKTGFTIMKFEHKTTMVNVSGIGEQERDVSELTIQREGDEPVVLVFNRVTEEKLPVASIQCTTGGQIAYVSRQQEFDCGGKSYIVVDITSASVIIMDKLSKEKHIHSTPGVGR
jgi:hypothetical protein